jgi:hypothetical protein
MRKSAAHTATPGIRQAWRVDRAIRPDEYITTTCATCGRPMTVLCGNRPDAPRYSSFGCWLYRREPGGRAFLKVTRES